MTIDTETPNEIPNKPETLHIATTINVGFVRHDKKGNVIRFLETNEIREGKIRGKSEIEVCEKYNYGDLDFPEKEVFTTFVRHRYEDRTNFFQVVRYKTGELKHVDCIKGDIHHQWKHTDGIPLENKFEFDDSDGFKIKCLECGASCDTHCHHTMKK